MLGVHDPPSGRTRLIPNRTVTSALLSLRRVYPVAVAVFRRRPKSPRFSIVMFTKNGMPFVSEAVASLAAQTMDDFEFVIQDAVSTDGTVEFFEGLGMPNVKLLSEPDSGLGDAYNRAFIRCTGEIVGTLDSDNLMVPTALETVDELFRKNRAAAAIYGAVDFIDARAGNAGTLLPIEFDVHALMRCALVPPFSTSYFNRRRCGGELRGDASLTTCQDFDLYLRLSDRKIIRTTTVLGTTRWSDKSMSRDTDKYEHFC